jgi:hypothetical protein
LAKVKFMMVLMAGRELIIPQVPFFKKERRFMDRVGLG